MSRITVTTANICCNPIRSTKVFTMRMRQAAQQGGIVFGQEIQIPSYDQAWNAEMARRKKSTHCQRGCEVPISLPRGTWKDVSAAVIQVHGGKKKVSPSRVISRVRATRSSGEKVTFLNCHPVSKPRKTASQGTWRMARWDDYATKLRAQVTAEHAAGRTVVFGGDMNKGKPPTIHREQQVLIHSGLDWLWVVPARGYRVGGISRKVIKRTRLMDHPILTASFNLTKAK